MRHKIACKRTRRRRKSRGGPYTAKPILTLDQSSSSDHGEATVFDDARKGASLHYDVQVRFGTGCLICKKEDNEDKILLCETCEGEYHTYCLQPALPLVPEGDWFCVNCLQDPNDGLEQQVAALPPPVTSRFGEICWAQGGAGYGWWPSIIYDPRLTVEPARSQARKHLGSRHLVYFFQCPDSPFSILPVKQIKRWVDGLSEDLHLGRAAKSHGKQRHRSFQEALRVACLEMDKPVHERLDWEHLAPSSPQTLSPQKPALKKRAAVAQNKPQRGPSRALAEATVRSSSLVSSRPPQMVSSFRLADTASSSVAVASGDLEYRSAAATEWTIRKKRRLSNGA